MNVRPLTHVLTSHNPALLAKSLDTPALMYFITRLRCVIAGVVHSSDYHDQHGNESEKRKRRVKSEIRMQMFHRDLQRRAKNHGDLACHL